MLCSPQDAREGHVAFVIFLAQMQKLHLIVTMPESNSD